VIDPIERCFLFNDVAELYDRARPTYPEPLFGDLFSISGLGPASAVLEIGCGTGQATRALARRCGSLTCIELGARLAALARQNLGPRAHIINSASNPGTAPARDSTSCSPPQPGTGLIPPCASLARPRSCTPMRSSPSSAAVTRSRLVSILSLRRSA